MAVAIEDAGFEVRDMLEWIYSSGFPKSLNVGKAVDKLQGNDRQVVGREKGAGSTGINIETNNQTFVAKNQYEDGTHDITKGNSEWEGFGTALKPAHEPIILARKPLSEKTIVENVLKHGTGAIDIDGCRIPIDNKDHIMKYPYAEGKYKSKYEGGTSYKFSNVVSANTQGRFPANIICTDDALNDGVMTKSGNLKSGHKRGDGTENSFMGGGGTVIGNYGNDEGSKSRYFDIDVWAEKY